MNEKDDILGGYFARAYKELMICSTKSRPSFQVD
jgi:hypothetical protein